MRKEFYVTLKEEVELKFIVIDKERNPPSDDSDVLYLMRDDWNDYSFRTLFGAYYKGEFVGGVKIAFRNMTVDTPTIDTIPHEFETLSNEYYSLWPGIQACQAAYGIYEASGCNIFAALHDISYDLSLFDAVRGEDACKNSLMRGVSEFAIRGQLHRIVNGKAALTRYSFSVTLGSNGAGGNERIDFTVTPEELPPTNVHVIIGRNGVGKTRLLRDIALAARDGKAISPGRNLAFNVEQGGVMDDWGCADFANVLVVSFSPFDSCGYAESFAEHAVEDNRFKFKNSVPCHFIGLGNKSGDLEGSIETAFGEGVKDCCASRSRFARWIDALAVLRSDPMFSDVLDGAWADKEEMEDFCGELRSSFDDLSSGHKAVLSIVTGCVAMLEERSLVLLDEPENHLHPPLLAAFIRAFSELLVDRNSVAVVATHSPVVLQEVPASCVWMLDRRGGSWLSRRPDCETFGANFERLTTQVFGVEIEKSGFHKMLREAVVKSETLEDAKAMFTCDLGGEAHGILRTLWIAKEKGRLA